jgi:hypothetical protein
LADAKKVQGAIGGRFRYGIAGAIMKMKAIIEVEYEAAEGQYRNVLESALMRGIGALAVAIEHGTLTGPTGIKGGSVITSVQKREIMD